MSPGDSMIHHYEARGGYGSVYHLPVTVVKVNAKRVRVSRVGRGGQTMERNVKPEKLSAPGSLCMDPLCVLWRQLETERAERAAVVTSSSPKET